MINADYLLLVDADMVIEIGSQFNVVEFKKQLTKDAYHIFQGSPIFLYKNVRLLKNNPAFSYWGVTHEYVKTLPNSTYDVIEKADLFIRDVGDGGSKTNKFERDIKLLLKGLEELPDNDRYTFYLANSYRDNRNFESAIQYYKKRIELGGWKEEVWFSYYSIGKCYKEMGDMGNAMFYWLEAYNYFPERIENLYEIITYYRNISKHSLAYTFYDLAEYEVNRKTNVDHLFLEKDVYDYKLAYEFSIIGYYCNRGNKDILRTCMKVLSAENIDDSTINNVINNYKFYAPKLIDSAIRGDINIGVLNTIGLRSRIPSISGMTTSTPSVCILNRKKMIVNVRYVNYTIGQKGNYINNDTINSTNIIAIVDTSEEHWRVVEEFELKYNKAYDNLYVGLEDIRLFSDGENLCYNSNRGLSAGNMVIEHGIINLEEENTKSNLIKKDIGQNPVEKNWVLFNYRKHDEDTNEVLFTKKMVVYGWHPLAMGVIREHPDNLLDGDNNQIKQLQITHTTQTPKFFQHVRGSTNGITIGDEIWFICHIVSYEDRRYYYHIIVILDENTLTLKRYSKMFTFEGRMVEYTLGFSYIREKNEFLIGYSTMDSSTSYIMLSKESVDALF
jgi:tetratricopeptide (TPR) repeat protein